MGASACALALRLFFQALFLVNGRFFATEDDGYRAYLAYLLARGQGPIAGRFWLPGQLFALAGLDRLGIDGAIAPLVLGVISAAIVVLSLRSIVRDLAPPDLRDEAAWGVTFVALASPLQLVLAHSALSEPFANALVLVATAALVRRARRRARGALALSATALTLATWVRYETWLLVAAWPLCAWIAARMRGGTWRAALADAAIASVPAIGPAAWFFAQARTYGDPVAFLVQVDKMSAVLAGAPSSSRVFVARTRSLVLWTPAVLVWSSVALAALRPRRAIAPFAWIVAVGAIGLLLEIVSGKGLGVFVVNGREFDFFSARLASTFELALMPLAGLGVAIAARAVVRSRARVVAASALAAACAVTVATLLVAGTSKMQFVDESSVEAGVRLRRGELDDRLGDGALLVERTQKRPPLGWAAVGVLWGRWSRIVWAMPTGEGWVLVEPTDVHDKRARVAPSDLAPWLANRRVTSAWTVSDDAKSTILHAWPGARVTPIGEGALISR
jgi:hypothetical protein